MITHTVGVVLAGGSSTRMGRDKASLVVHGTTLLDRVHGILAAVFTEVFVCGGSEVPSDGVLIEDRFPEEGPLGGLITAMEISRGRAVFLASVDVPLLTEETIRTVCEPKVPDDAVRIASAGGRAHPLVGVYGPDVAALAKERFESGQRSMFSLLEVVRRTTEIDVPAEALFNMNTQEEYAEVLRRLGA